MPQAPPRPGASDERLGEARSAILLAPSMVAWLELNALVNPVHPQAARITLSKAERRNLATLVYYPELKIPLMLQPMRSREMSCPFLKS